MDDIFDKLKQQHNNTVDNLIKWMQDSKLVEKTKACEDKARELFSDVANKSDVEIKKFQEAIAKLAAEHKQPAEDFIRKLSAEGAEFLKAVGGAAEAAARSVNDLLSKAME